MGYECPVCATPQADRRHLADHLAVTALTHGDDHADWLDEHVADWSDRSPADLGDAVADHATETDHDRVFEDTVAASGGDENATDRRREPPAGLEDALAAGSRPPGRGDLTDEQRGVLEEARAMTEAMLGSETTERTASADDEDEDE